MDNKRPSQCQLIVGYLKKHKYITTRSAMTDLGILRLASRISEMKGYGYKIGDEFVTVIDRFGKKTKIKRYWLIKEVKDGSKN